MKLAEALQERADVQKKIAQLGERLNVNARVQQGEAPAEDPFELLRELDECISRLEFLIISINKTNALTSDSGESLTALIGRRDCMQKKIKILQAFLYEASDLADRSYKSEIIVRSTISVSDMRKELDLLSKNMRELDLRIQQINWLTELVPCEK